MVIGSSGAGKSTLSRRLGQILGIEVVHLDVEHWRPGWVETPKGEWRRKVEELVRRDSWIMDGNFGATLDVRFEACDTVVFLDLSRFVCIWRVLKRWMLYKQGTRPDMAEGCHEKLDLKFLAWIWSFGKTSRPKVLALVRQYSQSKRIVWLRTRAEVKKFLAEVEKEEVGCRMSVEEESAAFD